MKLILLLFTVLSYQMFLRKKEDQVTMDLDNGNQDLDICKNKTKKEINATKFANITCSGNGTLFENSTCIHQCRQIKKVKCECPLNINEIFQSIEYIEDQVAHNYTDQEYEDPFGLNKTQIIKDVCNNTQIVSAHDINVSQAVNLTKQALKKAKCIKVKKPEPKNKERCCCCFYDEYRKITSSSDNDNDDSSNTNSNSNSDGDSDGVIDIPDKYYELNSLDLKGRRVNQGDPDMFLLSHNDKPLSKPYYKNDFDHDIKVEANYNLSKEIFWNQSEPFHTFKDDYQQTNITFNPVEDSILISQDLDLMKLRKHQKQVNSNSKTDNFDVLKIKTALYDDTVTHDILET